MSNTTISPAVGAATLAGVAGALYGSTQKGYVSEYPSPATRPLSGGFAPAPALAEQVIPHSSGIYAQSAPVLQSTRLVRVTVTAAASVAIGPGAVATGGTRLAANAVEYFSCSPGDLVSFLAVT